MSYIYKNHDDTVRVNIFDVEHEDGRAKEWNADVWIRNTEPGAKPYSVTTYSEEEGDLFRTKREAKDEYTRKYGPLKSINPKEFVTQGWEGKR